MDPVYPVSEPPPHLLGESERATASPDRESKRLAASPTGESEGATTSLDGELEMIIIGGDGGTGSSLGEGGFTTGDCGSAGTGSTRAGVGSGGAASLGLTIKGRAPGHATCSRNCSIVIIDLW